jgi:Spy/CpxP family protein refolding chaperone
MNTKLVSLIVAAVVAGAVAIPALADPPSPGAQPEGNASPQPNWQDKDVRQLVHIVMMARLAQELNLSDEDTVKLVRRFEEHRVKIEQNANERRRATEDLKTAIKDNAGDDAMKQKLDAVKKLDEQQVELRRNAVNDVSIDLTPRQQAQLYIFINDFENNVRRMIHRARELGAETLMRMREDGSFGPGMDERRFPRRGPGPQEGEPPVSRPQRGPDGGRQAPAAPPTPALPQQ